MTDLTEPMAIALSRLDPADNSHWTSEGQPRINIINETMVELGAGEIKRQAIIDQSPMYNRASADEFIAHMNNTQKPMLEKGERTILYYREQRRREEDVSVVTNASPVAVAPPAAAQPEPAPEQPIQPEGYVAPQPEAFMPELAKVPETREGRACDAPVAELIKSADLLQLALTELGEDNAALVRRKAEIEDELVGIRSRSDFLSRMMDRIKPKQTTQDEIQAYLKTCNKSRLARAKNAQAFIKSGVSRRDIADALRGASPIDAAMRSRKPAPGSTRPAYVKVAQV